MVLLLNVFLSGRSLLLMWDRQARRARLTLRAAGVLRDPQDGMFFGLLGELEGIWPAAWDEDPASEMDGSRVASAA